MDNSFPDWDLARWSKIPIETLTEPKTVLGLDGRTLAKVAHRTAPLTLLISGNHQERIQYFLIHLSYSPGVLSSPWLACHNPQFDWSAGRLTTWSTATVCSALSRLPRQKALSLPPHCPYDCGIDLLPGVLLPSSQLYNLSLPERQAKERYIGDFNTLFGHFVHP